MYIFIELKAFPSPRTQASSPIRRYCDHITHYQIKSFLREEPLAFSTAAEMEAIVHSCQEANKFASQVARQVRQ